MGLLSAIAGPLIGGIIGRSNAKRSQQMANDAYQQRLQWTVADAEKAGINPYFAIAGGAGNSTPGPGPRIVSDTAWANAFDTVEDILTGRAAAQARKEELATDIARVELDQNRASPVTGVAGAAFPRVSQTPGIAEDRRASMPFVSGRQLMYGEPTTGTPGGVSSQLEEGPTTITNPYNTPSDVGNESYEPPWNVDAESIEARDGEIGQFLAGLRNILERPTYNNIVTAAMTRYGGTRAEWHNYFSSPRGRAIYDAVTSGGPQRRPSLASRGVYGEGDFNAGAWYGPGSSTR